MKKIIMPNPVMTVGIILVVLGILAGRNAIKNYVDANNTQIKEWTQKSSEYQIECNELRFDNENLLDYKDELLKELFYTEQDGEDLKEEIAQWEACAERRNKKVEPLPVIPEPNFTDTIQNTIGGVVHIFNNTRGWQGSGVAITPCLILTARHVVEGGDDFTVTTNDGHKLKATRAISNKDYDVAFIRIDNLVCSEQEGHDFTKMPSGLVLGLQHLVELKPAKLASIKECKLGQQVYVIGSPYGKINFNSVSLGIISGLNRDWDMTDWQTGEKYGWQIAFTTDSAAHPGNSGCPVFTMDGKVRGIIVGGYSPVLCGVMPCDLFLSDIDQIDLMFTLDEYEHEIIFDIAADAWGY